LVAACSHIGLALSKVLELEQVSVLQPETNTIPTYLRIGFTSAAGIEPLRLPAKKQIDWQAQKAYLEQKPA